MAAVIVERDGEITTVTLNRPDALNTVNVDLVRELTTALDDIDRDRGCRVVILTGAGRAFSAGLDLNGYGDDDFAEERGPMVSAFERQKDIAGLAQRLHGLRQPVIAAVNGPAAGAGLALLCAGDIRIGSTASVYAVGFIRAGFSACDIGLSWLLPRLVGTGRAHELMLTGRKFDATQAEEYGLLVDLVEPEALMETARSIAQSILANPPVSVELTKVGMWAAVESGSFSATVEFENRQQMITAMTEDRAEATAAFLEKRSPEYRRR
ncbi:enoyl-CoA hydratase/isomerase family protein [Nocardia sp. 348MFTsu5.1]|uniref:enoyl-CoA hydratase/isomerase family protein n=1 Tax=Nocardia sp. 348MFTsu5.1 TaxID=1172185 RepID=UPI000374EA76|nr:enoyl-CoA hydratase-related protein [Nocardia sp. 348MFTsu5.1]